MILLYLVWFMVVMVIPPSSSKQAWPALGGSTEEQSKNLVTNKLSFRNGRFIYPQKEQSKNLIKAVISTDSQRDGAKTWP